MNIKINKFIFAIIIMIIINNFSVIYSKNLNNLKDLEINATEDVSIVIGPYCQNQDLNSITILWETNIDTIKNEVHWGITPDCENITSEYNKKNFFVKNLHQILLDGLSPSTKYYYKVISDDFESNVYFFYTTFKENETINFIVYGDNRGAWDNWQNATIIAKSIEEKNPCFVLNAGDLVDNGDYYDQWINFFSISSYIHNSTLYPILGNHESYGSWYFKYFILPDNERWYSFNNGPVHFVGLDSNPRNAFRLSQLIWLIKDLKSNTQTFTIVFFHHPVYSSGNHGSTWYVRLLWKNIFEKFDVNIVFNGHDHCYERGKVNNINYIVTGGGGAPLYNVGANWWTIYSEKTYHYCYINVNQTQLDFNAVKPDGSVIDTFTINKLN